MRASSALTFSPGPLQIATRSDSYPSRKSDPIDISIHVDRKVLQRGFLFCGACLFWVGGGRCARHGLFNRGPQLANAPSPRMKLQGYGASTSVKSKSVTSAEETSAGAVWVT